MASPKPEKSPAFSFYPKDWLSDGRVSVLSPVAEGLYIRLLCHAWLEGGIPADANALKQLVPRYKTMFDTAWKEIRPLFRLRGRRLISPRQEKERRKQAERSKSARDSALQRWGHEGTPDANALRRPMRTQYEAVPQTQCLSSSSSIAKNTTWLSPFGRAWIERYGGKPGYGKLAKALKPLVETHTTDTVLVAWTRYLGETDAQYASPHRFAETFGRWSGNGGTLGVAVSQHEAISRAQAAGLRIVPTVPSQGFGSEEAFQRWLARAQETAA